MEGRNLRLRGRFVRVPWSNCESNSTANFSEHAVEISRWSVDLSSFSLRQFIYRESCVVFPLLQLLTRTGTCTITIAMLNSPFFPRESIPELGPGPFSPSDVTNFADLGRAAIRLINDCSSEAVAQRQSGWTSAGRRRSMGVFLWTSGSHQDNAIPRFNMDNDYDHLISSEFGESKTRATRVRNFN